MQKIKAIHIIILVFLFFIYSCDDDFIENIESDQSFAASGKWENAGRIPGERCGAVAGIYNDYLYVIAGKDYSGYRTDAWKFSFEEKTFNQLVNLNYRSFAPVVRFDNEIYVWGGIRMDSSSTVIYSTVDHCVIHPSDDSYDIDPDITTGGDAPAGRYLHTSFTSGQSFYILGGTNTDYLFRMICILLSINYNPLIDFYRFDIENSTWYRINSSIGPLNRSMHGSVKIGDKVYLFGGISDDYKVFDDFWVLDLNNYSWTQIVAESKNPGARAGISLREIEGRIYLFGGFDENMEFYNDLWCFYPDEKCWKLLKPANSGPTSRAFYHMDVYNKKLLIYSGYCNTDDPVYFSDIWLYSPGRNEQGY